MNLENENGQPVITRESLGWITLKERRTQMQVKLMYKIINGWLRKDYAKFLIMLMKFITII